MPNFSTKRIDMYDSVPTLAAYAIRVLNLTLCLHEFIQEAGVNSEIK